MHKPISPTIDEYKIRASILMKQLRAGYAEAEERMRLSGSQPPWRRKHALAVIAREAGFPGWNSLKARCTMGIAADTEGFFTAGTSGCLNHWHRTYTEACQTQRAAGGYLFPFRDQYFVCDVQFIEGLHLDADPLDWERIGRNWVEPRDRRAFERLCEAMRRRQLLPRW